MIPASEHVRTFVRAVSVVKTLPQTFVLLWLSVIGLMCLLVRPAVIKTLGAQYWVMTIGPLYILLFLMWISFVILMRNPPRGFSTRK
jgi:hypothetical protein